MKSYAQDKKTVGDSIAEDSVVQKIRVQDSLILYQNIKNYSKKRKFTKMAQ